MFHEDSRKREERKKREFFETQANRSFLLLRKKEKQREDRSATVLYFTKIGVKPNVPTRLNAPIKDLEK